jgi:hypothetical protein
VHQIKTIHSALQGQLCKNPFCARGSRR